MKLIFTLIFTLFALVTFSQTKGTVRVTSSTNITNDLYDIKVDNFSDIQNINLINDIIDSLYLWTTSIDLNSSCQEYIILSVSNTGFGERTLRVKNLNNSGYSGNAQIGSGAAIVDYSNNLDLPYFIPTSSANLGMVNPKIQSCMLENTITKLDLFSNLLNNDQDSIISLKILQDSILTLTLLSGYQLKDTLTVVSAISYVLVETDNITLEGDGSPSNQIKRKINGKFASDQAASISCPIGEYYELSENNVYGRDENSLRKRKY